MPFKSIAQLDRCYRTREWNCDTWLQHTPSIACLPQAVKTHEARRKCIDPNYRGVKWYNEELDPEKLLDIKETSTTDPNDTFTHTVYKTKRSPPPSPARSPPRSPPKSPSRSPSRLAGASSIPLVSEPLNNICKCTVIDKSTKKARRCQNPIYSKGDGTTCFSHRNNCTRF